MKYVGTIVEESLKDNRILNDVSVVDVHITDSEIPEHRWHLYRVEIEEEDINALAKQLKPDKWYMHFWNNDNVIAVFPDKIFRLKHSDKTTWEDAICYGLSLNIPLEQLDFEID